MESHASTSSCDSAIAYALTHGLVISTGAVHEVTHIPFTLQPTPIPRKAYERAVVLAPVFNQLVDSMARDISFLCESLTSIAASDPFIGGLLELLRNVYTSPNPDITKQPPPQQWMLGIHRSDYMLEGDQLKQVEINTISSAFPALSTRMCELHDYVSKRWGLSDTADTNEATTTLKKRSLLYSESAEAVPRAMAHAVRVWCSERGYPDPSSEEQQLGGPPPAIVAFVVSPTERNIADQRMMEQVLWDSYRISSVRLTLEECSSLEMNATSGDVFVPSGKEMRGKRPIALAYFRSSYAPTDFYNKECWRGREILERSSAIKCPSIPYHLCTSKKIQQLLCSETVRRRFVNETDSALLASCMALQYDLSLRSVDPKVQHAIDRSIEDFHSHVLKPQREGGGNLIHGEEMATILTRGLTEKEATDYILMEMIHGTEWRNTIVAKGKEVTGNLSSELGIYGIFLGNGEPVAPTSPAHSTQTFNAAAGYLIRSKIASVADGGVVSGIASLSSALLFDSEML